MLSVILYGRNDSHGYNLHKRAALSLNSLAACLTDPDDEIVFVDWNSDVSVPPFPVAIADTLSEQARERLRIVRVSPAVHRRCAEGKTSRVALEPIARNVGIRRANPDNRWVLSTNTDILLRVEGGSLSNVVAGLEPGYYGLPRFELPEWLWESFPRTDPKQTAAALDEARRSIAVDRVVNTYDFLRFDAPGDFQLVSRTDIERIGCFDEDMLLGWHVDSNLARRLHRYFGSVGSLEDDVAAYHCNHTRTVTQYHVAENGSNDVYKFVFGNVDLAANPDGWGLPDVELETLTIADYDARVRSTSARLQPAESVLRTSTQSAADRLVGIPAALTMPFLVDAVIAEPRPVSVAYLGARADIADGLRDLANAGAIDSLHIGVLDGRTSTDGAGTGDAVAQPPIADDALVIIDLTPPDAVVSRQAETLADLSSADRRRLRDVFARVRDEVEAERSHRTNRRYLVINAEFNVFGQALSGVFEFMPAQYYSRTQKARIKDLPREPGRLRRAVSTVVLRTLNSTQARVSARRLAHGADVPTGAFARSARRAAAAIRAALEPATIMVVPPELLDPELTDPELLSAEPTAAGQTNTEQVVEQKRA